MGKAFSEKQYKEIVNECKAFKEKYCDTDEKDIYVQLVHESDGFEELRVTFDVYPKRLLYGLMDYALTPRAPKFPMFSYRFETVVDKELYVYEEIKTAAQRNDGWLKATLCDKDEKDCTFYGQLVWQCGDVEYSEVGIKMQSGISSSVMHDINRTTEGFNNKITGSAPLLDITNANDDSSNPTSYDVYLYKVGDANTTQITNTRTNESLLVDCGIERNINYRGLYTQTENAIKMFNPEYILISHNHEDHYNLLFVSGAAQAVALGFNNMSAIKQVIITDAHSGSLSHAIIKSLLGKKLLLLNPNIHNYQFVLTKAFPNVYVEFGICPGLNSCVGGFQSSLENDTGMIVSIKNNHNLVLTGDCSFDFIPAVVGLSDADCIVVPHHGGKVMMNNRIPMKSCCYPIVSSGFPALYTGTWYQRQYDQGLFLRNCGVANSLSFLKVLPKICCEIKGI